MILAVISSMVMAKSEAEQFGLQYIETQPGTNYIKQQQQAGYAIIPARNFDEMNRNGQFAQAYSVDCGTNVVYDGNGQPNRVSELNPLHQAASNLACLILDTE